MTYDDRKGRTDTAIKSAFLRILNRKRLVEINISELAREAHVSRSTIYSRYGNLSALYVSLIKDMLYAASANIPELTNSSSKNQIFDTAMAFCELLRNSSEYAPLVKEERFLPSLLEDSSNAHNLINILMDEGLDFQQAYTVAVFQMGGVFAVGTMMGYMEKDWPKSRQITENLVRATLDAAEQQFKSIHTRSESDAELTGPDAALAGPDTELTDPDAKLTDPDTALTGPDAALTGPERH